MTQRSQLSRSVRRAHRHASSMSQDLLAPAVSQEVFCEALSRLPSDAPAAWIARDVHELLRAATT